MESKRKTKMERSPSEAEVMYRNASSRSSADPRYVVIFLDD